MKKVLTLLVAVVAIMVCVVGCGRKSIDPIIGTWEISQISNSNEVIDAAAIGAVGSFTFEENGNVTLGGAFCNGGLGATEGLRWEKVSDDHYCISSTDEEYQKYLDSYDGTALSMEIQKDGTLKMLNFSEYNYFIFTKE